MTDAQIIQGLQNISIKLVDEMRFAEAEFVDQAIARILELPKTLQQMSKSAWENQYRAVVDAIVNRELRDYE